MDFSKIIDQRNSKASATAKGVVVDVITAASASPPTIVPPPFFLQGPTLEKKKRFLHLRGLLFDEKAKAKLPEDQSELLDEAVNELLDARLENLEQQHLMELLKG